jgi:hypothetical protein
MWTWCCCSPARWTDGARHRQRVLHAPGAGAIAAASAPTADGFVLRVDLRLRPSGTGPAGGQLASFGVTCRATVVTGSATLVKARPITAAHRYAEIEATAVRRSSTGATLITGCREPARDEGVIAREIGGASWRTTSSSVQGHPRSSSSCRRCSFARRPRPAPATPSLFTALACLRGAAAVSEPRWPSCTPLPVSTSRENRARNPRRPADPRRPPGRWRAGGWRWRWA